MPGAVGVIGLGQMGTPISRHLLEAGFPVAGNDLDPNRVAPLVANGGIGCDSPRKVAAQVATVLTSLPSAAALTAVLTGSEGLLAAGTRPLVLIETSTLALDDKHAARALAEAAGATMLDCPLSGTAGQAQRRDLVAYASGDAAAVERCRLVLDAFTRSHHYLGVFGTGSKMKYIANLLVAIHNVAAAEALVLAASAGMDLQTVYDVIAAGAGSSRMFEVRGPMMVAGEYDQAGASGRIFRKDLRIIADFAEAHACPTPLFAAAAPVYLAALAQGFGDQDVSAVHAVLGRHARSDPP